ncbi:hypothetical protein DFH06DRAFT_1343103 [Mycena polygramma]|nr:hypothetical protein DFH06DRAFT_1343103 [Mycena polygramma]
MSAKSSQLEDLNAGFNVSDPLYRARNLRLVAEVPKVQAGRGWHNVSLVHVVPGRDITCGVPNARRTALKGNWVHTKAWVLKLWEVGGKKQPGRKSVVVDDDNLSEAVSPSTSLILIEFGRQAIFPSSAMSPFPTSNRIDERYLRHTPARFLGSLPLIYGLEVHGRGIRMAEVCAFSSQRWTNSQWSSRRSGPFLRDRLLLKFRHRRPIPSAVLVVAFVPYPTLSRPAYDSDAHQLHRHRERRLRYLRLGCPLRWMRARSGDFSTAKFVQVAPSRRAPVLSA